MRIGLSSLLFLLTASCFVAGQQPVLPPDPSKLVIRPGGKGAESLGQEKVLGNKDGFLIIRPNGKGTTTTTQTTQVGEPQRPLPAPRTVPSTGLPAAPPPTITQADAKATKDGKIVFDYWFAVGVDGQRIGYVNWAAKEMQQQDKTFVVGLRYLNLTVSRFGQPVTQWGEESTVEGTAGDVLIATMRQGLGKDQALAITGVVEGKTLKIKGDGAAEGARDTPWPGDVVGLAREPQLFRELKLKPGETHTFLSYIPTVNRVLQSTITYEGEESRVLWANTPARKLHRFVTRPEPIGKVKLPASTTWVDAVTFEPLLLETDFPALGGRLVFLRSTREAAMAPVTRPVEVFNVQSIQLNREIPGIHSRASVVYKVTVTRDDEPETIFANESRQQVKNLDTPAKSFELHVAASHGPQATAPAEPAPGKEFTSSNFFINWDNDTVKALTAKALTGLADTATDWDRAVAIERWVKGNMKAFEFSQAMATSDNVAKTLSGDCTEYAMLAAAMARAAGIPSRTALGVVYAPGKDGKPFLAYHMWFEVFAGDQWVSLDATLGRGGIGPGHIKITDHSWHDERSFAPLLPVLRSLSAKPMIEVVKVTP